MKKLLIVSVIALAVACSPKTKPVGETPANPAMAGLNEQQKADFMKGKELYDTYCGMCHPLKRPSSRDAAAWAQVVPPMVKKVNKKTGAETINPASETILTYYLTTACTQR